MSRLLQNAPKLLTILCKGFAVMPLTFAERHNIDNIEININRFIHTLYCGYPK